MKNLFKRIERKIIIKNKMFISKNYPRFPKEGLKINYIFEGENALAEMVKLKNNIFSSFKPGDKILIKVNLNSPNPYPASTSNEMLETLLKMLNEVGMKKIYIGESSGLGYLPTRKVMEKKKYHIFKKYNARILVFDYGRWTNVAVNGIYFKNIIIPSCIYKFDRIINLANLKTHNQADFSFSTKLLIGLMHPAQRYSLHRDHLHERIAEMSLAIQPDLSIIDARTAFIDGGPDVGRAADANAIIIDSNLLNADLKAYNLLVSVKKKNGLYDFDENPYSHVFFKHFTKIGGSKI